MNSAAELKELMLREPRLTLAVAESVTAGRVQALVASVSGASEFFLGGVTAYTLGQKVRHLGVDPAHAAAVNCVSARVAAEMARGARALFDAEVALATTGYAEPAPAAGVTAPMAHWAIAGRTAGGTELAAAGRVDFPGAGRTEAQQRVAEAVLAELVTRLRQWRQ